MTPWYKSVLVALLLLLPTLSFAQSNSCLITWPPVTQYASGELIEQYYQAVDEYRIYRQSTDHATRQLLKRRRPWQLGWRTKCHPKTLYSITALVNGQEVEWDTFYYEPVKRPTK